MEKKKEQLEDFKTAISSTVRSLTNSNKIEVSFGNQNTKTSSKSIVLPELNEPLNKINFEEIRAMADSKSLLHRFSDNEILKKYEPNGNVSKKLYKISEKIRCENIGSSYFKGIKTNIEKFYLKRITGLDLKSSEDKIVETFENYLRVKFLDLKNETKIDKKIRSFKKDLSERFKSKITELKNHTLDQEKYNSMVSEIFRKREYV